ncbi:MAG: molybdopterin oxidoreductase family protein, partial [Alphaproteobacteria bacterium]|nr:molybdopterin oxidoreductase family protein [Alphaproteobacteria bacterium]
MIATRNVIRGACPHDCPDTCAWHVTVEDGRAVALQGDPDHPITRGSLCAKVNHFIERAYGTERLRHPLRRVGPKGSGEFERVEWDEALDHIAARLKAIIARDGASAILPYSYLGTQGLIQCSAMSERFFRRLRASRLTRAICGASGGAGVSMTNGIARGLMPTEIAHSRCIVLWGTNTVVTNLHVWHFIKEAQRAGARVVVVDPVRTRTAEQADLHVRPRPGTDAALALAMMHVIVRDKLHDADYVARHTLGFDKLRARLTEYSPERGEQITGVPAATIEAFARTYATTKPAVIRTLIGLGHHASGAMMFRTIACLPALTGAWRDRGGGMMGGVALRHLALNFDAVEMPELEDKSIRAINMVQVGRALNDPTLTPPIKSLFVYNSNPAAIAPNQNLVLKGLKREDLFTVVIEQFMTDTASHADYVLPATSQLEHWDLLWAWGHEYLTLNTPAIEPIGEARPNTEIFRQLARRMGFDEPFFQESDEDLIRRALTSSHPYAQGITVEHLREKGWARLNIPDGHRPYAEGGFPTPSGKCEFYSESMAKAGLDPLPAYVPSTESQDPGIATRFPLELVSGKSAHHFLNSSYANIPRQLRAEKEPTAALSTADATARRIADGDLVRVFNDRGALRLRARVGDGVVPGVVAIPSGWWASLSPGG